MKRMTTTPKQRRVQTHPNHCHGPENSLANSVGPHTLKEAWWDRRSLPVQETLMEICMG